MDRRRAGCSQGNGSAPGSLWAGAECYSGLGGHGPFCPTLDQCRRLQGAWDWRQAGPLWVSSTCSPGRVLTPDPVSSEIHPGSPPHRPWTPQGGRGSPREQNKALSPVLRGGPQKVPFRSCQLPAGDVFSHPLLLLWVCQALQRWAVGGSALRGEGPQEWTSELESAGQRLQSAWPP